MPSYCHATVVLLPCYCHAIGMPLPRHGHAIANQLPCILPSTRSNWRLLWFLHQQQHHEPISVAILAQVTKSGSNLKRSLMPPTSIIWQVREDQHGRWRDFPLDLQNQVETEWQRWQEGGAADEVVVHYVWPNAKCDRFSPYEIVLATGAMVQKNVITGKEREVRRLVCPD